MIRRLTVASVLRQLSQPTILAHFEKSRKYFLRPGTSLMLLVTPKGLDTTAGVEKQFQSGGLQSSMGSDAGSGQRGTALRIARSSNWHSTPYGLPLAARRYGSNLSTLPHSSASCRFLAYFHSHLWPTRSMLIEGNVVFFRKQGTFISHYSHEHESTEPRFE